MTVRHDFDVQVDENGAIHVVEADDPRAAPFDPMAEQAAAAVREEIAARAFEEWAPWITRAAVDYVLTKGGPDRIDVSMVVADEVAKRLKYRDLFAAVDDPDSELGTMLRGLVSRVVSPMGMAFAGDQVCDLVPRIPPGESCARCKAGGVCSVFSCGSAPDPGDGGGAE